MAGLGLLIRIARQAIDEKRVDLGHIGRARAEADAELAAHEQGLAAESGIASTSPELMADFSAWVARTAYHSARLKQRCSDLARIEDAAQDALREAFTDMKRLELARDSTARDEQREASRRADAQADEQERGRSSLAGPD